MVKLRASRAQRRPAKLAFGGGLVSVLLLALIVALKYNHSHWTLASSRAGSSHGKRLTSLPAPRPKLTAHINRLCEGTLGSWCTDFHTQALSPAAPAPRGNHTCSLDCNKVGVCSALTGLCTCPAGWTSWNCLQPMPRYCTHQRRQFGFEVPRIPARLEAGLEVESFWHFPLSHCAGTCDDDIAACYCPSHTPYGRVPAKQDAPLGSPPERQGRPMGWYCQPGKLPNGTATVWGETDPDLLFGPGGWCMAEEPKHMCDCIVDGWGGQGCQQRFEMFCLNQCNGRGECNQGYCKCDPGWHGIDCAHRSATADASKPGREESRPWIKDHVRTPAAQDFPPGSYRKHPLIYVYELPAEFASLMIQYRYGGDVCVPRYFNVANETMLSADPYAAESGFLEMLLQSEHRTLDPEEADYFFVPTFSSCLMMPVRHSADSLRDTWYGSSSLRVHAATHMWLEAYHWLKAHLPYWNRRGGRDHIWLVTHDEASCYVPSAIRPSIILSHWGRKGDANHTSGSGYWEDVYSTEVKHPHWEPDGYLGLIAGHACHDPVKDLIIPQFKTPRHFHASPLLGARPRNRTWLALHRGRVQPDNPGYSRGLRQRLATASREGDWLNKHRIAVGERGAVPGDYSELMASSEFCLVLPGDGWVARMDDATLHGCIPVIIMDEVDVSFESIVDLSCFTLRIPQANLEKLPEVLLAVPEERRQDMRRALAYVWQKFTYSSYAPYAKVVRDIQQRNAQEAAQWHAAQGLNASTAPPASLPAPVTDLDPEADDAFTTIMAWLHSRIPATR
ncbi:hypothetical protein D9Q98_007119 [Chlorella vulgaris]|uniref:EGF-like domain-containing protein n=1 Tax=Chlorella vulgaris TaxID=3077 RepID=A0A9D4TJI5_CHLVU|nr:hypothetical protein D9Q98_007119 [Chlorella vulgaris]